MKGVAAVTRRRVARVVGRRWRSQTVTAEASVAEDTLEHPRCPVTRDVKPYQDIPGPKPMPLIGNTFRLLPVIGQYPLADLGRVCEMFLERYGPIVRLSGLVGRPDLLFVFDADEIERGYRTEGPTPFRPSMPCLVKYKSEVRKDFFGDLGGVVGVHGEAWKTFRTKVQKPILQPQTVRKYVQPIEEVTEEFIDKMWAMRDANEEMPEDFDNEIHKWSLECIGRVALDVRLGCLSPKCGSEPQQIIDAAKFALRNVAIMELKFPFWRYIPTTLWSKYVNNMDFFREVCLKYINQALERLQEKQNRPGGIPVAEHELSLVERILTNEPDPKTACILALDLIFVGIDTISMAVCSMLYQLSMRQKEQEKLHEELCRVLPDPNTPITPELLDQMHYLRGFIKEVFRVYSTVIGNGRTLQQDSIICGYAVPKGVQLVFPTLVTGNMEKYVERASEFLPERWIKGTPESHLRLHPYASLPYGHGARMCLGRRFADLEMQILIAKLIRSYRLEFLHKPLKYAVTFMYAPDGPLRFKFTQRN